MGQMSFQVLTDFHWIINILLKDKYKWAAPDQLLLLCVSRKRNMASQKIVLFNLSREITTFHCVKTQQLHKLL